MQATAVLNLRAGRSQAGLNPDRLAALLREQGIEATVRLTQGPGHATELAAQAAAGGAPLVVAVGGDGTVTETARGLLGTGCALAVLPFGSGNDFAAGIGCPDFRTGLRVLAEGTDRALDAGRLDDRPFFNSLGLLASGRVSGRAAGMWRGLGGWRYRLASLGVLLSYRGQRTAWRFDDAAADPPDGKYLLAEICNGRFTGGGFRFAPDADPADGLLDACLISSLGVLEPLRLLPKAAGGRIIHHPAITRRRARSLSFETTAPVAFHLDGEPGVLPAGTYRVALDERKLIVRTAGPTGPAAPQGAKD